jgi:hypothetical protein
MDKALLTDMGSKSRQLYNSLTTFNEMLDAHEKTLIAAWQTAPSA